MKKNIIFNILLTLINLLYPILSFPYASQILGPEGIGKVQFVLSFSQYFTVLSGLGISVYGVRQVSLYKNDIIELRKTFTELFILSFASSLIIGIIYIIIIFNAPFFNGNLEYFYFSSFLIFSSFTSVDWFYSGIGEFSVLTSRTIFVKLLSLLLLYITVKFKSDEFIYLVLNILTLSLSGLIGTILILKKYKISFKISIESIKVHIKPLFWIFSIVLSTSMYTLFDSVILGFLTNNKVLGFYTAGVKLTKVVIPLVTAMGVVLLPKVTKYLHDGDLNLFDQLIQKSLNFVFFISIPLLFYLFFLSKDLIIIFSGRDFIEGVFAMKILSFLPIVIGLGHLFGIQILIASGQEKQMLYSVVIGMILSVTLNLLLIPYYEEKGAAIANLISEIFVTASYYFFSKKKYSMNFKLTDLKSAIYSSFLIVPIFFLIKEYTNNSFHIAVLCISISAPIYLILQLTVFKNEFLSLFLSRLRKEFEKIQCE